ncbi:MAG: sulfite exporter TauE/SafE family protein [Sediminibacterium sp.]
MFTGVIVSGFILGAAGSLHCIGMCGPLSMILPTQHLSKVGRSVSLLLYQVGRVITYALLGMVFGLVGRSFYLAGFQQWFSIIAGAIILLLAGIYFLQRTKFQISFLLNMYGSLQKLIARILMNKTNYASFLLLGMANGLLPCGMVYAALAVTLSLGNVNESIVFMAMFGAGTLPAMLLFSYGFQFLKPAVRTMFRNAVPVFTSLTGLLLILRGLNLGIMFISPALPKAAGEIIRCYQ